MLRKAVQRLLDVNPWPELAYWKLTTGDIFLLQMQTWSQSLFATLKKIQKPKVIYYSPFYDRQLLSYIEQGWIPTVHTYDPQLVTIHIFLKPITLNHFLDIYKKTPCQRIILGHLSDQHKLTTSIYETPTNHPKNPVR